ncbi:MAG: hypothetical protein AAFY65_03295 [Pseudomonadota bacterium]
MSYAAVVFASVGAVADLEDLDRRAFNLAFHRADLDWVWEPSRYKRLQTLEDDAARIAAYAVDAGDSVDVAALWQTKRDIARDLLRSAKVAPKTGVLDLLDAAKSRNVPVALCARRSASEVYAVMDAMAPTLSPREFSWIGDSDMVKRERSLADVFDLALCSMQVQPDRILAVVDTPYAARAASAVGVPSVVLTGGMGAGWHLPAGTRVAPEAGAALMQKEPVAAE